MKKFHLSTTLYDIKEPGKNNIIYFITIPELKNKLNLNNLSDQEFKNKLFNELKNNNIEYIYEKVDYTPEQEEYLTFSNKKEAMKFINYLNKKKNF